MPRLRQQINNSNDDFWAMNDTELATQGFTFVSKLMCGDSFRNGNWAEYNRVNNVIQSTVGLDTFFEVDPTVYEYIRQYRINGSGQRHFTTNVRTIPSEINTIMNISNAALFTE